MQAIDFLKRCYVIAVSMVFIRLSCYQQEGAQIYETANTSTLCYITEKKI